MSLAELEVITAASGLRFYSRPGSSDPKVVIEVVDDHEYRKGFRGTDYVFDVLPDERWLDLGANIGTFAVWAASKGAEVVAFEPERITYRLLEKNIALNDFAGWIRPVRAAVVADGRSEAVLSLGQPGSEWRNTLMKHKTELAQLVACKQIEDVLRDHGPFDGIKADIEGAELAMFDAGVRWVDYGVKKLVFEMHFDIDPIIANFQRRIAGLRGQFEEVRYGKFDETAERYEWFPPSRVVYCWNDDAK